MQNYVIDCYDPERNPDIRKLTVANGIEFPSDEELIMLILGRGCKGNPIERLAEKVVDVINLNNQENLFENLIKIPGVGESKALAILASLELGRRRKGYLHSLIKNPDDIIPYVKHYALMPAEHFIVVSVNGAKELLTTRVVAVGSFNKAIIHPRDVFASVVQEHASGIICCHNHPCGSCYPSHADIESTKILQKAAKVLGIAFLDHIIVTESDHFSFLEHGLLDESDDMLD